MKYSALVPIIALFFAAVPFAVHADDVLATSTCPHLTRALSAGMSGQDVVELQDFLISEHVLNARATGYFGALTTAAVHAWQAAQGLVDPVSTAGGAGIVGPRTRSAIAGVCGRNAGSLQDNTNYPTGRPISCPVAPPPTLSCVTGWQAQVDEWGCVKQYQCVVEPIPVAATTTPICPVIKKPVCSGTLMSIGTSTKGCLLGYVCTH